MWWGDRQVDRKDVNCYKLSIFDGATLLLISLSDGTFSESKINNDTFALGIGLVATLFPDARFLSSRCLRTNSRDRCSTSARLSCDIFDMPPPETPPAKKTRSQHHSVDSPDFSWQHCPSLLVPLGLIQEWLDKSKKKEQAGDQTGHRYLAPWSGKLPSAGPLWELIETSSLPWRQLLECKRLLISCWSHQWWGGWRCWPSNSSISPSWHRLQVYHQENAFHAHLHLWKKLAQG